MTQIASIFIASEPVTYDLPKTSMAWLLGIVTVILIGPLPEEMGWRG